MRDAKPVAGEDGMNFLNSGAGYALFREAARAKTYVDKTMMIDVLYRYTVDSSKYVCVTRPRRFGKSVVANMIAAFFDESTKEKSTALFQNCLLGALKKEQEEIDKALETVEKLYKKALKKDKVNVKLSKLKNKKIASVHVELPDSMTVEEVDNLTRHLEEKVYGETAVILTGVGVYSYNTKNNEAAAIRNNVQKIVLSHDFALQMHGFYIDQESKTMRFDTVINFGEVPSKAIQILTEDVIKAYPEYTVVISPDVDVSD